MQGGGSIAIGDKEMDAFLAALPEPYRSKVSRDGRWAYERPCSIQLWLNEHPGVEAFTILDDHGNFAHLYEHHVHTRINVGLTKHLANKAIDLLGGPA